MFYQGGRTCRQEKVGANFHCARAGCRKRQQILRVNPGSYLGQMFSHDFDSIFHQSDITKED